MQIQAHRSCEGLAHAASNFINSRSVDIQDVLGGMTLHIGPANSPEYRTPAAARDALFVGDGAHMGVLLASDAIKVQYAQNPKSVQLRPLWNSQTQKFDMQATQAGFVGDADPIASQSISPWNQGWFSGVYDKPLLYSHADKLVVDESGNEPWCEVMNLMLADYQGGAVDTAAGSSENSLTKDVNVKSGMMTSMVINMFVTYSITLEETARAEQSSSPYGSTLMTKKVQYANYVLEMLTSYLTYYGNTDTDTQGLFNVNGITPYAGTSIAAILAGASTTKGSDIYAALAGIMDNFFGSSFNKFSQAKVGMSTYAFNKISSTPYSANYSPKSPLKVFEENYIAGMTKDGRIPRVEFYADPMLDASTDYNSTVHDYLVITAPKIGLGPEDAQKNIILRGMPLSKFAYPVVPGMVNQQHRVLRRYAGVFAPVGEAVSVISGFGK